MIERDLLLQKVSVLALKQEWRGDNKRGRRRKLLGRGGKGGEGGVGKLGAGVLNSPLFIGGGGWLWQPAAALPFSPPAPHPPSPHKRKMLLICYTLIVSNPLCYGTRRKFFARRNLFQGLQVQT